MTDRVFIRHLDHPDRNGYVSLTAFDALWSKKGYVIEGGDDAFTLAEPDGEVEEAEPAPSQDDLNAKLDEKDQLRRQLEANGIEVDGRWGLKRLRTEVANLEPSEDAEPTCSICGAPAVYEIEGAPEEKGDFACEQHRSMWPLSEARPLSAGTP